jgi:hypothetical protein
MKADDKDPLLSEEQAAQHVGGKHPKTLAKWRHLGRGPAYVKLLGSVKYRLSDLNTYIASCVVDPATAAAARNRAHRQRRVAPPTKPAAPAKVRRPSA